MDRRTSKSREPGGAATLGRLRSVLAIKSVWGEKNGNNKENWGNKCTNTEIRGAKVPKDRSWAGEAEEWNQEYILTAVHTELHTHTREHTQTYTICPSHFLSHTPLAVLLCLRTESSDTQTPPDLTCLGISPGRVCVWACVLRLCLITGCTACSLNSILPQTMSVWMQMLQQHFIRQDMNKCTCGHVSVHV